MDNTRLTLFATVMLTIDVAAASLHCILNNDNRQQQAAQCLQQIRRIPKLQQQIATAFCASEADSRYVEKKFTAIQYTVQQLTLYTTAVKNGEEAPFDIWTAIVFLHYIDDRLKEIRTYFEIQ